MQAHASAARAEEGSFLQRFFAATERMSPEARGAYLERPPPEAPDIDDAHRVSRAPTSTVYKSTRSPVSVPAECWHRVGFRCQVMWCQRTWYPQDLRERNVWCDVQECGGRAEGRLLGLVARGALPPRPAKSLHGRAAGSERAAPPPAANRSRGHARQRCSTTPPDAGAGWARQEAAQEGATAAPPADEPVLLHFVALVEHEGRRGPAAERADGPRSAATCCTRQQPACLLSSALPPSSGTNPGSCASL